MTAIPALNYPIIGPPKLSPAPADGSVLLRREIRDLQHNFPDQWTLYILGLQSFQQLDEKSDLSWYGIAGIHGRPYRPWGGVKGDNPDGWQGYCTHSSILFAPWHRPYLALFEVSSKLPVIHFTLTTEQQYLYQIIQQIAATFPTATKTRYQQAALTFRIPYWDWAAAPPAGDKYFPIVVGQPSIQVITPTSNGKLHSRWPSTLRYPTNGSATAKSQEQQAFDAMESQFDSYQMYTLKRGNGHMSAPDYAAFDPLFWLHHTNVDRQFAIWQALTPIAMRSIKSLPMETFSITSGTQKQAQWKYLTVKQYQTSVLAAVQTLYGATTSEASTSTAPIKYREYIAIIRAPKHILHQTYRVRIFLGDFNSDPATWATEQATIGTFSSFGKDPQTTGCGKCIKDEARSLMISGTVPLTPILLKLYQNVISALSKPKM
ncbi:hypothetical protein DID88_009257 [Monilinia fructigena]|uniref:tyrosinase n=1 Tax=Monilinia fructigena TaxID=38457 RepID=A0A395IFJ8_9HELO|nr:hypothetical protein DID88_009257 [Monilinia fructigena]